MYIIDYNTARVLMEAKLLDAESGRPALRGHPAAAGFRRRPIGPFATVYNPAARRPKGGH